MSFSCTDKDTLVAYIYGECDAATRGAVDAHLAGCPACADEVAGFGVVRDTLSQWSAPERAGGFRLVRDEEAPRPPHRPRCCGRRAGGSPRCRRSRARRRPSCSWREARRWPTSRCATTRTVSSSGPDGRRPPPAVVQVAAPREAAQAPAPQPAAAVSVPTREPPAARSRAVARRVGGVPAPDARRGPPAGGGREAGGRRPGPGGRRRPRSTEPLHAAASTRLLDESERRQQVNVATE